MNIRLAEKVLRSLAELGVREFCLCAGARNSPLVCLLEKARGVTVYPFFEERSAAFFALGRMQSHGKPVAVVTTSGTAVAECLPAAVEATYTNLPLIVVSADRPRAYRGTGAPQAIDQLGIFSHYAQQTMDIAHVDEELNFDDWTRQAPLHLNVCFDEPLLDGVIPEVNFSQGSFHSLKTTFSETELTNHRVLDQPLVIVGALPEQQREKIVVFLENLKAPIYAEALSGLRGESRLKDLFLNGGEKSVEEAFEKNWAQSLLRLGGVPTLRFWRDLEDAYAGVPVHSLSDNDYTGLSRNAKHLIGFHHLVLYRGNWSEDHRPQFFASDRARARQVQSLCERFPHSEAGLVASLARQLKQQSVYLGNSLPIREWDLVSLTDLKLERISANRGANGIDGQISTFLGWCEEGTANWALVGDLTALYDLASLWISPHLPKTKIRLVIINNGGGQIFKNIFNKEIFLNRHQLQFEKWAEMWGWSYRRWPSMVGDISSLPDRVIIEMIPNETQSNEFYNQYSHL